MKRIYLLFLFVALASTSFAQRTVDLTIKHFYSATSTVSLMQSGDKLLINGSTPYYFAWRIFNNGTDSTLNGDTIAIRTPWTTFVAVAGTTFTNNLKMGDSVTIVPQNNPVTLSAGSAITSSGPRNIDWCDSVFIRPISTSPNVTDPAGNNKTCTNVEVNYWLTDVDGVTKNSTEAFILYPNPVTNKLNMKYNFGTNNSATVNVIDITGKVVHTQDLGSGLNGIQDVEINLGKMNSGLYILQLTTNDKTISNKFHIK